MLLLLLSLIPVPAHAEEPRVPRCQQLQAESLELTRAAPVACEESRQTQKSYVAAFPAVLDLCNKLEAQVAAGPPKLQAGTEDQMYGEVISFKQRHLTERRELADRLTRELLPTPLDNNDPTRPPPQVGSECGSEVEAFVRFRRSALRSFSEFYNKIDQYDEGLFLQAQERAQPAPARAPAQSIR